MTLKYALNLRAPIFLDKNEEYNIYRTNKEINKCGVEKRIRITKRKGRLAN